MVIALEVSSAARQPPFYGSIAGAIRNILVALLREDSETTYLLCHRIGRARRAGLVRLDAPNARSRVTCDPFNALLIPRARLFHSMGIHLPHTPRIPKLVTIHDLNAVRNLQWTRPRWHARRSAKIRACVERADHVVTYSDFIADEIADEYGFPRERVHAVPLGVDTQLFRPPTPDTREAARRRHGDYLLCVAQMLPRKNLPRLLEALAPLTALRLVLVASPGEGEAAFEEALERTGMRQRVTRLSEVSPDALVALLGGARLSVMPSLYEGFGLPVLEAMACGTPVVCSRAASLPEVAGRAAELVDATCTEALREAIRRVAEDTELAERLRQRGLARAADMSWTATARRLRDLYHGICS